MHLLQNLYLPVAFLLSDRFWCTMATKNGTCANPIPLKNVSDAQVIVVTPREMRLEVSDVLGRGGQNYLIFVRMLGAVHILRQPPEGGDT